MSCRKLVTEMRGCNVVELEWSQMDLEQRRAWIHADQAKGKKALHVPLNSDAVVRSKHLAEHTGRIAGPMLVCTDRAHQKNRLPESATSG